jgi:hypothetical protein
MTLEEAKQKLYKPGDIVELSGIYVVTHDTIHYQEHEVTCVSGKHFPPCIHAGHHPRFKLKYYAQHIETHEHFQKN